MAKNKPKDNNINPILKFVDFYTQQDIDLFPLPPGKKFPPPKDWQNLARTSERAMKKWFAEGGCNIGVACGNGLMVVDIDIKGGKDGLRELHKIENKARHTLPSTFTVRSPTGGLHYYFFYDPEKYDVASRSGKLADGIDIKADTSREGEVGGFVVGVGSTIDKGTYTVEKDAAIAEAPDWFLQLVERRAPTQSRHKEPEAVRRRIRPDDRSAIMSLPADNYEDWYTAGMACKESFGDAGFELWREWSAKSAKYPGLTDCANKWQTFDVNVPNGITFGSIVHRAKAAGWTPETRLIENTARLTEALDNEMDPSDRREWLSARMPVIERSNLPNLKLTAKGDVSTQVMPTILNVDKAIDFMGVNAIYNAYTHECEIEYGDDGLQDVLDKFEQPQEMLRHLVWGAAQQIGFTRRQDWDDAINAIATDEAYHPVAEWISSEPWDGVDRFPELVSTLELHKTPVYVAEAYLRRWFIQGIQAAFGWKDPQQLRGCMVLSGPQKCGKTTWFGSLVPPHAYKEGIALNQFGGAISTDSVKLATSAFLTELGELETTFSRADSGALKNFLTSRWDEYRVPYGRAAVKHPRTTIFCGTVNHLEFLRDSTGSSRFWCVAITRANAFHDINIQQLWAQALTAWERGESWFLTPAEEEMREAEEDRFVEHTVASELLAEHMDLFGDQDKNLWLDWGLRDVCERLEIGFSNGGRREAREALKVHTGADGKKINGIRNRWFLPKGGRFLR